MKKTIKIALTFISLVVLFGCKLYMTNDGRIINAENKALLFLENNSFEVDKPRHSYVPTGWVNCAINTESPPDIHGSETNFFGLEISADEGRNFLGLVARSNNTWESIGQELTTALIPDYTYTIELSMRNALIYNSKDRVTGEKANFENPLVLRIWGGKQVCQRDSLLFTSDPVTNTDSWEKYSVEFLANDYYNFIILEGYYEADGMPYNGNLLIDYVKFIGEEVKGR